MHPAEVSKVNLEPVHTYHRKTMRMIIEEMGKDKESVHQILTISLK
jgi:hypothetical protein